MEVNAEEFVEAFTSGQHLDAVINMKNLVNVATELEISLDSLEIQGKKRLVKTIFERVVRTGKYELFIDRLIAVIRGKIKESSGYEGTLKLYDEAISKLAELKGASPIVFREMQLPPTNENGVILLTGILMGKAQLPIFCRRIHTRFPDMDGEKDQKSLRIEFELRASNFRFHQHDEADCNIIICWENDWPDCPLEVISLKEIVEKLLT